MRFADILGHEEVKKELRDMVDSDRIPHALLLSGMQGLGKMRMARAFVQYIYCPNRQDGEPCGRCPACIQTEALNNPDVHWVFPVIKGKLRHAVSTDYYEQWKEMLDKHPYMEPEAWNGLINAGNSRPAIMVDEAEDITAGAPLSSFAYRYKTYVVWLPERMRAEAANKLLKLIEEPYEDTLFIMVSDNPGEILPTVFSRTRRVNMRPVPRAEIEDWLTDVASVPRSEAIMAAQLGDGSPGRAIEEAANCGEREEFGDIYRLMMRHAYRREVASLKELSESVADMGREKNIRFLDYCNRMTRENFISNLAIPPLTALNTQEREFSTRFAPFINFRNVERLAEETDRAANDIARNANAKITMFDYMLSLCALIRVLGKG